MKLSEATYYCHLAHWAETRSATRYTAMMAWWVDVLGDPCLDPMSGDLGARIRAVVLDHRSSSTRRKYLAVLAKVLRAAALHLGMPKDALVDQLGLPKYRAAKGRTLALSDTQAKDLVDYMPAGPARDLTIFLLDTGARVSEAMGLAEGTRHRVWTATGTEDLGDPGTPLQAKVSTQRTVGRVVTFRNTKSSTDRTIPLTERARAALDVGWRGLSYTTYRRRLRKAGFMLGVTVTPHVLRHTCITRLVMAGVPLPVVQGIAGHSSIETTMKYTHPDISDYACAIAKLG